MNAALESLVPDPLTYRSPAVSPLGQLLGFGMVGAAGALAFVVLSSLAMGLNLGAPNWLVSTLCYGLLIYPVYLLHRRFSFRSEAPHRHALPRYLSVQLSALLLASAFSYVAYHLFDLPTVAASIVVTGLTSCVSFGVLRVWAFTHPAAVAAEAAVPLAG